MIMSRTRQHCWAWLCHQILTYPSLDLRATSGFLTDGVQMNLTYYELNLSPFPLPLCAPSPSRAHCCWVS